MLLVSKMMWPLIIGQLVLVFAFSALASRVNTAVAALMFLGYSLTTGLLFSTLFFVYTAGSIASTFFVTAGAFGALSVFGLVTKRDLSPIASFLFIGLIGLVLAGIVNIFLHSEMLSFVASCAGVLVFAGLTAYDTQKLKSMHATAGYSSSGALAIRGALTLYLDFINMFIYLLRLFGRRR
jgi:FtsH-binding integral membrane protein